MIYLNIKSASDDDRIYPINVEVTANGTVQTYPVSQLYAHCDFDFADFPYDTQSCDFIVKKHFIFVKIN